MKRSLPEVLMLSLAAVAAVAVPAWLLWPAGRAQPPMASPVPTLPSPGSLPDEPTRSIFAGAVVAGPDEENAPELIGIAGRLPGDAVAMVRGADGTTKTLSKGQSHDGWRLQEIAADAALFERDGQRVRSVLPPADPVQ